MNESLFDGSRIKLQRASTFISELETVFKEYNESDPLTAIFDHSKGAPVIRLEWKGLDLSAGAILGDAIHNLRAALDLMASEMATLNGHSNKDVYFPFAASEGEFPEAIKRRNFHKAGDDAVVLLLSFAPYKGGNERLRAIHDLDIRDKHTAILDTEKKMNIPLRFAYDMTNLADHKISIEGTTITHHFWSESPLSGLPIIETLKELVQLVESILKSFVCLIQRRRAKG